MPTAIPWPLLRLLIAGRARDFPSGLTAPLDFVGQWLESDIGDRLDRINALAEHPTEDVRLEVEGYMETIRHRGWTAQLNAEPYDPWRIGVMANPTGDTDADLGRLGGDGRAAIRAAITSTATSIAFDPSVFRWTTDVDDFTPPLRVRLGGEVVDVSNITTTAATFVAAGTVAHAVNASVTPSMPAGVAAGDLLLVLAAIRNSGGGEPVTPDGYVELLDADNVKLFGKVHSGSEVAPTVIFANGVANADTTAQMAAFRNMPTSVDDLDIVVSSAQQLNASAQDIAYPALPAINIPGCVVLVLGWKQDDWTSVATLSGFTEIGEPDTTTGDDQGIVWDYVIQTTPDVVLPSSFSVTGGASAISVGAVVALAGGFQTLTVSARSTNGVVKDHPAGTNLEVEDVLIHGL